MKSQTAILTLFVLTIGVLVKSVPAQDAAFETFGIKKLAFESGPGSFFAPHEDIFVLDSLKAKPRHLAIGTAAVWSPDGKRIAYCAHEGWGTKHIVFGQMQLINADGSGNAVLTSEPGGACPIEWSADGKRIAFSSGSGGGVLVLDEAARVTSVLRKAVGLSSPDGSKLAFSKYRESRQSTGSIWVAHADGANPRKVIDDNSEVIWLCWSPDGESIVFSSRRENKERSEIFRVKLDGSGLETLAADKKMSFVRPSISPDGKYLVVTAYAGSGEGSILLLDLANHTRILLAHGEHASIAWEKR